MREDGGAGSKIMLKTENVLVVMMDGQRKHVAKTTGIVKSPYELVFKTK